MGCGSSVAGLPPAPSEIVAQRVQVVWQHPSHALLPEWSAEDLDVWFSSLPIKGLQASKDAVLGGTDGAFAAAKWTTPFLVEAGLNGVQSMQLMAFRDKAAVAQARTPSVMPSVLPAASLEAAAVPTTKPAAVAPKSKLKANVKLGISVFRMLLDKAGPMLPFPGAAGVLGGLSSLLGMVESSIEVSDNVAALQERSFDLLEVMMANSAALRSNDKDKAVRLLSNFNDILAEVILYATEYTGRNWLMKVITSGGDSTHFTELQARLQVLVADATLGITADIRTQVAAILTRLDEPSVFVDQGAPARDLIKSYGGIAAVITDVAKMDEVMMLLDPGNQLNAMLIKQAIAIMGAISEEGVHRLIKQADMCVFWRKNFKMLPSVDWKLFWAAFPSELADNPMSPDQVDLIQQVLASSTAQTQFQLHVARSDTVGVQDIKVTFLAQADLLSTVQRLAGGGGTELEGVQVTNHAHFQLPQPDAMYSGREVDALEVLSSMKAGGPVVCLVAQAGMGKSSLALDVGARLRRDGLIPGGACFVDMREARSSEDVMGRFSSALDVSEDGDASDAILAQLRVRTTSKAPMLLLLDNAEDPLAAGQTVSDAFTALLGKIASLGTQGMMLLITSRQELHLGRQVQVLTRRLSHLPQGAAQSLVRTIVPDLSSAEAATVASVSGCVPLLLRLVASALASGRMVMQEVNEMLPSPDSPTANVDATVQTMLAALPKQQQHALVQLSVFSSCFDEGGAAAVMGVEVYRARGIIQANLNPGHDVVHQVLYKHDLIMFNSAKQQWSLHMAVKTTAQQLPHSSSVLVAALTAFVLYVMDHLNQWGNMYNTGGASTQLALQLARELHNDTLAVFARLAAAPSSSPTEVAAACSACWFCNYGLLMYNKPTYLSAWRNMVAGSSSMPDKAQHTLASACFAESLRLSGNYGEAEPILVELLELRTRSLGVDSLATLSSMTALAACRQGQGRFAEAEALHQQTLELRTRLLGGEDADTVTNISDLAICMRAQGGKNEAVEPMYRRVLELRRKLLGSEHPHVLNTLFNLANCIRGQGRNAEAEPLYRQALELQTRLLGSEHLATADTCFNLANCIRGQGKNAEAEPFYRKTLDMQARLLGDCHAKTSDTLFNFANCMRSQGKNAEAEPLYRRTLAAQRQLLGGAHQKTANTITNLTNCLRDQGKPTSIEAA